MRPFGAVGDAAGTLNPYVIAAPLPVQGQAFPGSTLQSVPRPMPTFAFPPMFAGVASKGVHVRQIGLDLAANSMRGSGPALRRAPTEMVYATAQKPGVVSQYPMVRALAQDIRHPDVAPQFLPGMASGATRITGASPRLDVVPSRNVPAGAVPTQASPYFTGGGGIAAFLQRVFS